MEIRVITPTEEAVVMYTTAAGRVSTVYPAPLSSRPRAARPSGPTPAPPPPQVRR